MMKAQPNTLSGRRGDEAAPPVLSLAEAARGLVIANGCGVLATLRPDDGYPYASQSDYLPLDDGDVVFLYSRLAEHRRYLAEDARASLLVAPALNRAAGLAEARVTLLGRVAAVDREGYRDRYLARHPQAGAYVDFDDFGFLRLRVERARYIAGFGRMGWLDGGDYHEAVPDLLAEVAAGAIRHMNDDHADSLRDYARAYGGLADVGVCRMTALDRYGFDLVCRIDGAGGDTGDGGAPLTLRIGFDRPLRQAGQLRPVLADMARRARASVAGPGADGGG